MKREQEQAAQRRRNEDAQRAQEDEENLRASFKATWRTVWESADQAERDDITARIQERNEFYQKGLLPTFFEMECLRELARRRGTAD